MIGCFEATGLGAQKCFPTPWIDDSRVMTLEDDLTPWSSMTWAMNHGWGWDEWDERKSVLDREQKHWQAAKVACQLE